MASNIKVLKEANGDITYPQTLASAVIMSGGADLESTVAAKADATAVNGKISVGNVVSTDMTANSVNTTAIADGAVTTNKIGNSSVSSDKVAWSTMQYGYKEKSGDSTIRSSYLTDAYTIPQSGVYLLLGEWSIHPNTSDYRVCDFTINGARTAGSQFYIANGVRYTHSYHSIQTLSAGDEIKAAAWANSSNFYILYGNLIVIRIA